MCNLNNVSLMQTFLSNSKIKSVIVANKPFIDSFEVNNSVRMHAIYNSNDTFCVIQSNCNVRSKYK